MLFVVIGIFRKDLDEDPVGMALAMNEHLVPGGSGLNLAGCRREAERRKRDFMSLLDADNFARAEDFLLTSPFRGAGLYDRAESLRFETEVGVIV